MDHSELARDAALAVVFCLSGFCSGQVSSLQGSWNAEFKDSLGSGTASLILNVADSQTSSGTYQTNSGGVGTVAVKTQPNGYKFILTQTTQGCGGSFVGELGLIEGRITGTYSGSDCNGWHENGVISLAPSAHAIPNETGESAPGKTSPSDETSRPGYVACEGNNPVLLLDGSAATAKVLARLSCGESISILGALGQLLTKIRSSANQDGYLNTPLVGLGSRTDLGKVSQYTALTQDCPSGTMRYSTSYGSVCGTSPPPVAPRQEASLPPVPPGNDTAEDYPLSVRVLQTEQVPYVVQTGGGQASTSCAINGVTNTTGMAVASGNVALGNATSYSNLTMNCHSYQMPPTGWRHVLNTMLVVASNNNAYIIACDAAWRWSKCRGLVTGDTFQAKLGSKGLDVEYYVNQKPKHATYAILQGKVLGR